MSSVPQIGTYVATRGDSPGEKYLVESVSEPDEDGYFLVELVSADDADNMGAIGQELDRDDWNVFVEENGLVSEA
jgi:hypothetical protein